MAVILAATSGVFSATTTWIGGVVPTSVDDAVANGFIITITSNVIVDTLRNDTSGGATATGGFDMNTAGISLTARAIFFSSTVSQTLIRVTATSGLCTFNVTTDVNLPNTISTTFISHTGNCNLTTNGNFYGNPLSIAAYTTIVVISKSSTGLLTHNGNIRAGNSSSVTANNQGISNTAGSVIVNGNVLGNTSGGGQCNAIVMGGSSVNLTVVGNVTGGITTTSRGINVSSGNVTVTGNINGNIGSGIISTSTGTINVTGDVVGGSTGDGITQSAGALNVIGNQTGSGGYAINFTSNGALTITGIPTASSTTPAIISTSTGIVQMTGPFINNSTVQAVQAVRLFLNSTSTFWRINTAAGVQRQFSTVDYIGGYPGVGNVRNGVVFGQLGEFTGTLIIPPVSSVRKGVPVDATVGTGELTAADFLTAIDNSTSGIGLRFKNVSTVDSVGSQIAAFNNT